MKRRSRTADFLVYLVVRILICVVQGIRMETGTMLGRWLARLFCDVLRIRGALVDDNLAHAFPQLSAVQRKRLALRMWEHLFLLVLEVAHAPRKIHETNWRQHVTLRNSDQLVRLLLAERPLLVVTAHLGNFELGGYLLGILGFPTYTVARALDNPFLDRFVSRFRGITGQRLIPKNGGYEQILDVLAHAGTMALLADQYAGAKGCWVQFFGRPASAHKAIALLALENDAPVAICSNRRLDRPLHFIMDTFAILDPRQPSESTGGVRELTQWYTSRLEDMIRLAPEQYWWLHRRWRDPRPPRQARKKAA